MQSTETTGTRPLPGIEKARILSRGEHGISRRQIAPNALKVMRRLADAGFHAFLVGGGVRDLLLGGAPKDFDVATDATPDDVRGLFRNARIIGRRFRIVHIRFGREVIEVTTFRAHHEVRNRVSDDTPRRRIQHADSAHSPDGMLLRDNVYGDIDEDARRRDFTVNALYYTADGFRVLDFHNGFEDLDSRLIRMIGDPAERYREDPVRMLRALRFSAKLDFDIEAETARPIGELAHLLRAVPPARLFDEALKMLIGGHAAAAFELLRRSPAGPCLFAPTLSAMERGGPRAARLVELTLAAMDRRAAEDKDVSPALLFAALLWPVLEAKLAGRDPDDRQYSLWLDAAAGETLDEQAQHTVIPRRFTVGCREIWSLQHRLARRHRRTIRAVSVHPRFRAAWNLLRLREEAEGTADPAAPWWAAYQEAGEDEREAMIAQATSGAPRRRRPRRRRRRGAERAG